MKATAVIPAYNEAARIRRVLDAVAASELIDEIIVVDDGSDDNTAEAAESHNGAVIVRMPHNRGKAAALTVGVRRARNAVVVFLDADLVGLTDDHVDGLVRPVLDGDADMTVGQFSSGSPFVTAWMRFCPAISGQRAMRAADFLAIPRLAASGYGVEVVVTRYALNKRMRIAYVHLPEITHVVKESKRGVFRGLGCRMVMYGQILRCTLGNGYHDLLETAEEREQR
jgi:glycosyltransferase involved in cell wall biosynthesis